MGTYLLIGHLTIDRLPEGERPGGTVLYAGRQAAHMGYDVGIVTSTAPAGLELAQRQLEGISVWNVPSETATTFDYPRTGGARVQLLTARASSLGGGDIPLGWEDSEVCHLAPVADEVGDTIIKSLTARAFLGITPQGWMRRVDERFLVVPKDWEPDSDLLSRTNGLVFSRDDVSGAMEKAKRWSEAGPVSVVTAGSDGCTVFERGAAQHVPAKLVAPHHEIGAGDVFAAAFFANLANGVTATNAAHDATAAATTVISQGF